MRNVRLAPQMPSPRPPRPHCPPLIIAISNRIFADGPIVKAYFSLTIRQENFLQIRDWMGLNLIDKMTRQVSLQIYSE